MANLVDNILNTPLDEIVVNPFMNKPKFSGFYYFKVFKDNFSEIEIRIELIVEYSIDLYIWFNAFPNSCDSNGCFGLYGSTLSIFVC